MNKITDIIKTKRLFFDGGMGTLLQKKGLLPGEPTEVMNSRARDTVIEMHLAYLNAGADIIKTNSFGINSLKCDDVEKELTLAIDIAKEAVRLSGKEAYIAFDVGPTGRMLKPFGDLEFEDAVSIFAENMRLAESLGADLVLIETMSDLYETKAAVLAAKENTTLPIFVTCAFGEDGKLLTGATPEAMVALLEGLGVDALGMNCSVGPRHMLKLLPRLAECASVPIIINPNAGLPEVVDGETVYTLSPAEFAALMAEACHMGACVVGGCCGTTPEHISAAYEMAKDIPYRSPVKKDITAVSSYTHTVTVGGVSKIVGERINPTGKPKLKEALRSGDISHILSIALSEEESGAHILDVNVGLADIDEKEMMCRVIREIQAVSSVPLQIDSSNPVVLEQAMRIYSGKPLINSLNGSEDSMHRIFPLIKKYGGVVVALTMDEGGIPETSEERFAIAQKILSVAESYGVDRRDIIFDPLTLTVASGKDNGKVTLDTVKKLKSEGCRCILGISNVSFGFPQRDLLNASFYTAALFHGLDLAIINPESEAMMRAYNTYKVLAGVDGGADDYVAYATAHNDAGKVNEGKPKSYTSLGVAIEKGLKNDARDIAEAMVKERDPLDIINREVIPALDRVGEGFENKTVYLPGLLASAEAANYAFSVLRRNMPKAQTGNNKKIVLATVKNDIHDIGKNIVKLIFESYGYEVIDLGRDVPTSHILYALRESGAELLGLSALMTTTLPSMEETVAAVRKELPRVKIIVGGAVITGTYAERIGADFYAPDAMAGVRFADALT